MLLCVNMHVVQAGQPSICTGAATSQPAGADSTATSRARGTQGEQWGFAAQHSCAGRTCPPVLDAGILCDLHPVLL